jgi:anti-sigma factor RsiW
MNVRTATLAPGCLRVSARLPERCDGALSALEAARDEGHVESCAACAAQEAAWRADLSRLAEPLEDWRAALIGLELRLDGIAPSRPGALDSRRPEWLAIAAAAALLLYGSVALLPSSGARSTLDALVSGGRELGAVRLPAFDWRSHPLPEWLLDEPARS